MNWLDLVIVAIWGLGLIAGWRMGLFGAVFTTGGVVVGVFLAARLSDDVAELITDSISSNTVATVVAYGVILLAVFVAAQLLRLIAKGIMKMIFLGWVDSLGGLALGLVIGVVLSSALVAVLARYSSDLPLELLKGGPIASYIAIERTGIQEKLNTALVGSTLVNALLNVRGTIPGQALGFVPDDFKIALDVLQAEIDRK